MIRNSAALIGWAATWAATALCAASSMSGGGVCGGGGGGGGVGGGGGLASGSGSESGGAVSDSGVVSLCFPFLGGASSSSPMDVLAWRFSFLSGDVTVGLDVDPFARGGLTYSSSTYVFVSG